MMPRGLSAGLLAATLLGSVVAWSGCDKPEQGLLPAEATPPATRPQTPPPPTTQDLLTGPRTSISLETVPGTISVPPGWKTNRLENEPVVVLTGPTPHGEVVFLPGRLMQFTPQTLELYLERQRQTYVNKPSTLKFDIRDQGGFRVLEIVTVAASDMVEWRTLLMANTGLNYEQYKVSCILPRAVYEQDKAFLESILGTIAYTSNSPLIK
jgi:hypothetical protein